MTTTIVSSGQTLSGRTVASGDALQVDAGGKTFLNTLSGGTETIAVGGIASGTTAAGFGSIQVVSGGFASGTTLSAFGTEQVTNGGSTSATLVLNSGAEVVLDGTAFGLQVTSGGSATIFSGASASGATIFSGGTLFLRGSGAAVGTTLNAFGTVSFVSGGIASATSVASGATLAVNVSGAVAVATRISSGGRQTVSSGGAGSGTVVLSGGTEAVGAGGSGSGTTVGNGGIEVVSSGGTASAISVRGGTLNVSGGTVSGVDLSTFVSGGSTFFAFENVVNGGAIASVVNSGGTLFINAGGTTIGSILRGGREDVFDGTASGTVVSSGGSQFVSSGATARDTVVSSGGTMSINSGAITSGTTLLTNGTIDVAFVPFVSGGTANLNPVTDVLTVTEGAVTYTQQLSGSYTGQYFHLASDGGAGTLISVDGTPCYCHGTLILTDRGEIAVESLAAGDVVVTAAGVHRAIRWLGRRGYAGRFVAGNREVLPVVIRAGALGDGLPRRDLMVSPLHAMFVDGVLVPASALVNGSSVVQLDRVERVDYVHVELETHDVILAEGAASETFVDDGSRGMFANAGTYRALHPNASPAPARYCAPRVEDGPALLAIRRRIAAGAGVDARAGAA